LALAANTASAILSSIQLGLGLSTAGLASFGVPGAIGALSVVVSLAEAQATGNYNKFGQDLVAALAAGIGIGAFTGSPYAGALAFTIVLNLELGSRIGQQLENVRQEVDKLVESARPDRDAISAMSVDRVAIPVPQAPSVISRADEQSMVEEALGLGPGRIRSLVEQQAAVSRHSAEFLAVLAQQESSMRAMLESGGPFQLRSLAIRDVEASGLKGPFETPEALVEAGVRFADILLRRFEIKRPEVEAQMERLGIDAAQAFSIAWVTGLE